MISPASSWAISGIHHNMQMFNDAAQRITDPETVAGVQDIAELKMAEHGMKVNAAVLKVTQEVSDSLIDILA